MKVNFPSTTSIVSTNNVTLEGSIVEVIDYLSRSITFTYELISSIGLSWGQLSANGSFNGMIGLLQRKEVDVAHYWIRHFEG